MSLWDLGMFREAQTHWFPMVSKQKKHGFHVALSKNRSAPSRERASCVAGTAFEASDLEALRQHTLHSISPQQKQHVP